MLRTAQLAALQGLSLPEGAVSCFSWWAGTGLGWGRLCSFTVDCFFLWLGWLSKSYWLFCSGSLELQSSCWKLCTLFWVILMVPAFFLFVCQGEYYSMGVCWEGITCKFMQSSLCHGGPFPSNMNAAGGTRGEVASDGVGRQLFRSDHWNYQATLKHGQREGKRDRHNKRKVKDGNSSLQTGIKIAGGNSNNLRYANDTTLMSESEEELKSLLMKVKEEMKKLA